MKRRAFFYAIIIVLFFAVSYVYGQPPGAGKSPAPAVYVASTPCSSVTRPLPGIPASAGCELMKWKLTLYGSGEKQDPGTYILNCDYGLPLQGTRSFINGGTHLHRKGKWIAVKGTAAYPNALIYRLDPDQPKVSVSLLRLNENLLHLLDSDQHLMIGSGAWSYTLNRTKP
jgi:hypothetical protein